MFLWYSILYHRELKIGGVGMRRGFGGVDDDVLVIGWKEVGSVLVLLLCVLMMREELFE